MNICATCGNTSMTQTVQNSHLGHKCTKCGYFTTTCAADPNDTIKPDKIPKNTTPLVTNK